MTGVRVGSRLEQLERLAAQVQLEIEIERRRLATDGFVVFKRPTPGNPAADRCEQLGVTTKHVKEWAVRAGILESVARGRLALWVVQAYDEAHP